MNKDAIAPALRDALQRCGGMDPKDGFYEFLERVNRIARALEQEAIETRVLDTTFGRVEVTVPARVGSKVWPRIRNALAPIDTGVPETKGAWLLRLLWRRRERS